MPKPRAIPPRIEAEIERAFKEGLSVKLVRLRLLASGVVGSERSVSRWMSIWKAQERAAREAEAAERRRIASFEALGRGAASVCVGLTGAHEILRASAPEFRQRQEGVLKEMFADFIVNPSAQSFCALTVGAHAFLLGLKLVEAVIGGHGKN